MREVNDKIVVKKQQIIKVPKIPWFPRPPLFLTRVHAEAVELIVAHVEACLAGGSLAQLPPLLRVFSRVPPRLQPEPVVINHFYQSP